MKKVMEFNVEGPWSNRLYISHLKKVTLGFLWADKGDVIYDRTPRSLKVPSLELTWKLSTQTTVALKWGHIRFHDVGGKLEVYLDLGVARGCVLWTEHSLNFLIDLCFSTVTHP